MYTSTGYNVTHLFHDKAVCRKEILYDMMVDMYVCVCVCVYKLHVTAMKLKKSCWKKKWQNKLDIMYDYFKIQVENE